LNVLVSLKNATYSNTIGEASIGKKTCLQDEKTIKPSLTKGEKYKFTHEDMLNGNYSHLVIT
jgi:hypothetical protein